ncbi:MAG: MraY family glycosyltransferase, partial [Bryocella sp.]
MYILLVLGAVGFLVCLLLTWFLRDLAIRLGFVDYPDAERKLHVRPIPRIGGVAIMASYALALGVALLVEHFRGGPYVHHSAVLRSLLPAVAVIFLTGLADDLFNLRPWQKLLGQFAGASIAVGTGTALALGSVAGLQHSHFWTSPWLNIPLSLLWLVGCSNAVNLIDGLDGLAAGVGFFATGSALIFALITGNMGLAFATMPLAACLLAFLCFNFNPASIFLGDSGSLSIG